MLNGLARVAAPPRCGACDLRLDREVLLCRGCADTVVRWKGEQDPLAFGAYGGALASLLLRLKYASRADLGPPLGRLLADRLARVQGLGAVDVVVPVPVPRSRLHERGFNQAALIARPVATALGAWFEPLALGRREGGVRQAALGRTGRLENLQGAYFLRRPVPLQGQRVLIIDDVSTTGATLRSCSELVWSAGAKAVRTAAVARVDDALDPSSGCDRSAMIGKHGVDDGGRSHRALGGAGATSTAQQFVDDGLDQGLLDMLGVRHLDTLDRRVSNPRDVRAERREAHAAVGADDGDVVFRDRGGKAPGARSDDA